ncbi:hypothetical protein [Kitasatospora sp. NPDC057198]|uniref:glycine-rich domain-containing protein n=1 Tax=Kitasatospora sp. NPDC057198 TaxID=3346046 RepID=UPI0036408DEC
MFSGKPKWNAVAAAAVLAPVALATGARADAGGAFHAEAACAATCTVNVPAGYSVHVRLWGAGGGGGGRAARPGGGGAGGYTDTVMKVGGNPGGVVPVTVTIGRGGAAGTAENQTGGTGEDTSVTVNGVTAYASGGTGGSPTAAGAGGAGSAVPYTANPDEGDSGGGFVAVGGNGKRNDESLQGGAPAVAPPASLPPAAGSGGRGGQVRGDAGNSGAALIDW